MLYVCLISKILKLSIKLTPSSESKQEFFQLDHQFDHQFDPQKTGHPIHMHVLPTPPYLTVQLKLNSDCL